MYILNSYTLINVLDIAHNMNVGINFREIKIGEIFN